MNVKSLGLHLLLPVLLLASQPIRSQTPSAQAAINNPSPDQFMVWQGAKTGNLQDLQNYVVGKHISPNFIYSAGGSPLWAAVKGNHPEAVQFLLDYGTNIELGWFDGSAPLHAAARQKDPACLKLLLAHHANVNIARSNGQTAVYWALDEDLFDNARLLTDAGAVFTGKFASDYLGESIRDDKVDRVRFLLDHGADPNSQNAGGTPLFWAVHNLGDPAIVKLLLDHHADPLAHSNDGLTVFSNALSNGKSLAIIQMLVDHGVTPNEPDKYGLTPLFHAVTSNGQEAPQIVAFLLDHGANVNESVQGTTPLMSLLSGSSDGDESIRAHTAVLKLLLLRGAKTTLTNNKGQTALDQVRWNCYLIPQIELSPYARTTQCMAQLPATYKTVREKDLDADDLKREIMPIIFATLAALPKLPEVPEDARRLYVEANTTLKAAQSQDDIKTAIAGYQRSILACLWYSSAFYNLSLAQEKISDFAAAKTSMGYAMKLEPQLATNRNMQDRQYTLEAQQNLADKNAEQQRILESRANYLRDDIGGRTMYQFWVMGNRDFTPCSAEKLVNHGCFSFSNVNSPGLVGNGHDGTSLGSKATVTTEGDHVVITLGTQRFCIPAEDSGAHVNDCGSPAKGIYVFDIQSSGSQYITGGDGKTKPSIPGTVQVTIEKCDDSACTNLDMAIYWYKP